MYNIQHIVNSINVMDVSMCVMDVSMCVMDKQRHKINLLKLILFHLFISMTSSALINLYKNTDIPYPIIR